MTSPETRSSITSVYLAQVCVASALLTSAFMLTTATELGPMGPLVIAEGLYLAAFALVVELGLLAHAAYRFALTAIGERRVDKLVRKT